MKADTFMSIWLHYTFSFKVINLEKSILASTFMIYMLYLIADNDKWFGGKICQTYAVYWIVCQKKKNKIISDSVSQNISKIHVKIPDIIIMFP